MKQKILMVVVVLVTVWAAVVVVSKEKPVAKESIEFEGDLVTEVDVLTIGDLLYHSTFLRDSSQEAFYEGFKHMDTYFQAADIVIGNYETTTNPNRKYSGYPMFNTPNTALKAIAKSGINVLNTNNNHSIDTGLEGIISTLNNIRSEGILTVGTQLPGEAKRLDLNMKGISVGIVSYSYGYNGLEGRLSKDELNTYVSKINESEIEKGIKDSIAYGNDFTLVVVHWGYEYHIEPSSFQKDLAKKMSKWGADVVIGGHPHVMQPTEMIDDTFVIYSLGNYVSDQRLETLDNIETERGAAIGFTLEKNHSSGEKRVTGKHAIPTWVYKRKVGNLVYYEVLPAQDYLDGKLNVNLGSGNRERVALTQSIIAKRLAPGLD